MSLSKNYKTVTTPKSNTISIRHQDEEEQTYSNLQSLQTWIKEVKEEDKAETLHSHDDNSHNDSILSEEPEPEEHKELLEDSEDHEINNVPSSKRRKLKKRSHRQRDEYDFDEEEEDDYNENNVAEEQEDSVSVSDAGSSDYSEKFTKKKRRRQKDKKKKKKTKSRQKRRQGGMDYLEVEAESDENEESEAEEGGEISKAEQEKIRRELYEKRDKAIRPNQPNQRKRLDILDQSEEEIKKRYEEMEEENQHPEDFQEGRQPSISDPKLWLVKCRPGKEKECAENLYHKYFSAKNEEDRVKILSVICFDSLKGYIYVEAFKEANVREAIIGISLLRENSIKIVPLTEMTQVFNLDQIQKVDLKPKQWVRIKNGLYEGDLAQIVHIEDPVNKIYVRIVPRLTEESKDSIGEYARKLKKSVRPSQKLFNPQNYNDVVAKSHPILREQVYAWNKMTFKDGFMIKSVKVKSLIYEDVVPKIEELRIFDFAKIRSEGAPDLETDNLISAFQETEITKKKKFGKGDKIKIIKGGLKGITGKIDSHSDGVVSIIADVDGVNDLIELPDDYVIKEFLPGDLVRVVMGPHVGKHGLIVKVEDETAYIFSDSTNTEFSASCRDIVYSNFQTTETEQNNYFQLGDLVKINGTNTVCYVLDVQKFSLKLIDTRSEVKKVSVSEVTKFKQLHPTGIDSKRNPISKDDTVKITNGSYKGKRGVIRNIFKNFVFLYNQDFVSTNGIFVDKSENLEIMGSELLGDSYNMNGGKVNIRKVPEELRKAVGTYVRIIKGNWKGYIGVLKRVTDKNAAIELTSKNKTITIDVTSITPIDDNGQTLNRVENSFVSTPRSNFGARTPAYYPQSPSYGMGMSPGWNPSATPNYMQGTSPNPHRDNYMSPGRNYK